MVNNGVACGQVGLVRGFRDYFCCGSSQPLIILFCSPVPYSKQAGQKGAEHLTMRQARGLLGKFLELIFSIFNP